MSAFTWSPQQTAFFDWCKKGVGSLVLRAGAGTGKTTTIMEGTKHLLGSTAVLAYNTKIADVLKAKVLAMFGADGWKRCKAGTVHSFGLAIIKGVYPKVRVDSDSRKVPDLVDAFVADVGPLVRYRGQIAKLVGLAKQSAFGVAGAGPAIADNHAWLEMADHFDLIDADDTFAPLAEIVEAAQAVLLKSNQDVAVIDFDDMVYLPLVLNLRVKYPYDNVVIDEAQDTNAARRALCRILLKKGGRLIAVGDECQAIYGFTGADADALDLIASDFNCEKLPLSVTYRCPKAVVKFAHQWVDADHLVAAPEAPEGVVSATTMVDFLKRNDLNGEAAVLCRLNAPLVALAFALIRQRTPCRIEGRDIGNSIKKLLQRWKVSTLNALSTKLDAHLARETTKLLAAKKETLLAQVQDQVETVRVIIDQCRAENKHSVADAVAFVDTLFGDNVTNMLTLSSIHKSKGREWQKVFWLDRLGTCPSKWARQAWQQQQERNLMYVAATRAQAELIDLEAAPK